MVKDDTLCATCHETYYKAHRTIIHGNQSCEECHGPASEHLRTRGTTPGLIRSFKTMKPADAAEVCISCHDKLAKDGSGGTIWRTGAHAHSGATCTSCHRNHYTVPPGTPATKVAANFTSPPKENVFQLAAQEKVKKKEDLEAIRATYQSLGAPSAQACLQCHKEKAEMLTPAAPHQVNGPHGFKCASCHDPHGVVQRPARTEQCQSCHQDPKTMTWPHSAHAEAGLACVDCHNPHAAVPKLGAANPQTCYRCHNEKADLERIAHPHQINGQNCFQCQTCHNPHDRIRHETRTDVCLSCHQGHSPVLAWQSSIHATQDVACTDCHNPHPQSNVPAFVDISHTHIDRPKRLPMSVDEPRVCYRCHQKIEALFSLPYHHPLPEGKMTCSGCHDSHGQYQGNLKEELVNLVCYKCHAEKQGPFVFEHPPVTENCAICHNPHGSVDKGMLLQPATFLCLRCHPGHHGDNETLISAIPGRNRSNQRGLYTNCAQCHTQIHGTNRISNSGFGHFTR
jgi:DmsE family decaheme c-type cytochrome